MVTEKILVVDDEESVCKSVRKILTRKGYDVADALSVPDAVEQIRKTRFDLVITDLMIPRPAAWSFFRSSARNTRNSTSS
jgi:DNA-binding response OmpR family regulator